MSKKGSIPDAWDDDWVAGADTNKTASTVQATALTTASRSQRKAQHAEANKQLWQSADNPQTLHFVEARNTVPLKSEIKPQLQLLSRKPKVIHLNADEDEDDSEEERRKRELRSIAEKQEIARREREEKQKRYAEVRQRLFGSPSPAGDASLGRAASPAGSSHQTGRGNRRGGGGGGELSGRTSRSGSSADHSPARGTARPRELFDPDASSKPKSMLVARRENSVVSDMTLPIRQPKGPDGSGRGGFGFASRNDRPTAP